MRDGVVFDHRGRAFLDSVTREADARFPAAPICQSEVPTTIWKIRPEPLEHDKPQVGV